MVEFKNILVATDFSESAKQALELGIYLAQKHQASLTLLHTFEAPIQVYDGMYALPMVDFITPVREAAEKQLDETLKELRKQVPEAKGVLASGVAWQEILRTAEEIRADVIVMGTHGHRGLVHALLGSVAEKTVRMSPVPVLTVRAHERKS